MVVRGQIDTTQFWYGRSLKIHGNLTQIAEPGDRILVIYGASHAPYLRQFGQDSGYFEVLDPLPFLTTDVAKSDVGKR